MLLWFGANLESVFNIPKWFTWLSLSFPLPPLLTSPRSPMLSFLPGATSTFPLSPPLKDNTGEVTMERLAHLSFPPSYPCPPRTKLAQGLWVVLQTFARFSSFSSKRGPSEVLGGNGHSHDPRAVLPNHFPSGLSVMRMISMGSPCLQLSSFFPPLTSQQARAWWMTSMGPASCREERETITGLLCYSGNLEGMQLARQCVHSLPTCLFPGKTGLN